MYSSTWFLMVSYAKDTGTEQDSTTVGTCWNLTYPDMSICLRLPRLKAMRIGVAFQLSDEVSVPSLPTFCVVACMAVPGVVLTIDLKVMVLDQIQTPKMSCILWVQGTPTRCLIYPRMH